MASVDVELETGVKARGFKDDGKDADADGYMNPFWGDKLAVVAAFCAFCKAAGQSLAASPPFCESYG